MQLDGHYTFEKLYENPSDTYQNAFHHEWRFNIMKRRYEPTKSYKYLVKNVPANMTYTLSRNMMDDKSRKMVAFTLKQKYNQCQIQVARFGKNNHTKPVPRTLIITSSGELDINI